MDGRNLVFDRVSEDIDSDSYKIRVYLSHRMTQAVRFGADCKEMSQAEFADYIQIFEIMRPKYVDQTFVPLKTYILDPEHLSPIKLAMLEKYVKEVE